MQVDLDHFVLNPILVRFEKCAKLYERQEFQTDEFEEAIAKTMRSTGDRLGKSCVLMLGKNGAWQKLVLGAHLVLSCLVLLCRVGLEDWGETREAWRRLGTSPGL